MAGDRLNPVRRDVSSAKCRRDSLVRVGLLRAKHAMKSYLSAGVSITKFSIRNLQYRLIRPLSVAKAQTTPTYVRVVVQLGEKPL